MQKKYGIYVFEITMFLLVLNIVMPLYTKDFDLIIFANLCGLIILLIKNLIIKVTDKTIQQETNNYK
jgi:predicted ABC-type exoprotein transport system permease subunit